MAGYLNGRFAGATCVVLVLLLGGSAVALAHDVQPGYDLYETDPANTRFNFAPNPIPPDFFGPGSDPFAGTVDLEGLPLALSSLCPADPTLCPDDDLNIFDTIVRRPVVAALPGVGSVAVIDIELVAISLRSTAPITVTYNGGLNPELWDVEMCNSPSGSPPGTMTISHSTYDGGTFSWQLPVVPYFRFTRQSDGQVSYLDGASAGMTDILQPPDPFRWRHETFGALSCRSNFCAAEPIAHAGTLMNQGLYSTCSLLPALPGSALLLLGAALAGVGLLVIGRLSRRAARTA